MEPNDAALGRLERWKRSLLDLTLRNRLLDAKEGARCVLLAGVDPVALAAAVGDGAALAVVAGAAGLADQHVGVALAPDELARRLAIMARALREGLAEGGTHTLWLGLGALRWVDGEGGVHRAPIALWPVTLARTAAGAGWTIAAAGDDARRNQTLVEKLRADFEIALESPDEDAELDVAAELARFAAIAEGKAGWGVEPTACLGVFSFAKLVMWTDLAERADRLIEGPVAHHLAVAAGTPFPDQGDFPAAAGLDGLPIADTLMPLDCDASQLAAVLAGADGKTFVLQGPPGTGKSQTIANLIAAAIARGKTVLFVSEKMAALEVVERRLAQAGLGGACLELHSHKARKKDVVDQLHRTLRGSRPVTGAAGDDARLGALRAALDGHVAAMHEPGALGVSMHGALARLVELRDAAKVALTGDGPADAAAFAAAKVAIADYARAAAGVIPVAQHPWRASTLASFGLAAPDEVGAAVTDVAAAADEMIACLRAWADAVPGFGGKSMTAAEIDAAGALWLCAARTPRPGAELITAAPESADKPAPVPERLAMAKARAQSKALAKAGPPRDVIAWLVAARLQADLAVRLEARWSDALDAMDLEALAARFRRWADRFALLRWWFLRGARGELRRALTDGADLPADPAIAADLEAAIEERRARRALDEVRPQAARWLGTLAPAHDGTADLEKVDAAIAWATELRAAFEEAPVRGDRVAREAAWKALVAQVASQPKGTDPDVLLARSANAIQAWRAAVTALAEHAGVAAATFDGEPDGVAAAIARAAAVWRDQVPALRDWAAYVRARGAASARGLAPACEACEGGAVTPAELPDAWERATLFTWAEGAAQARGLAEFTGAVHHARVADFADLDRGSVAVARARIAARIAEQLPKLDHDPSGEIAVLVREAKKQRGHRPLRRLFRDLPTLLTRLTPCVLMSPLSVAQYLDPALERFDLVIFDEASQIPTADAIGALARGAAAIVVGDSKQLPPTRFFASGSSGDADDDEDDDGVVGDLESVLDECVAARLPELQLRWHYRSRHEDLIAFANARYYEDRLHVFPAASPRAGDRDLGVELRQIDGVYNRAGTRTNRAEAAAVVAEVAARVKADAARSLGVVTFSRPQQALVEDLLDLARAADAALDAAIGGMAEPLIVKNLETVQGDERDVMILSIGYGPDAAGAMTLGMGPLGQAGGERRLNVAATRAREKLLVFSSIPPETCERMVAEGSVGVRHLAELVAHARGAAAGEAAAAPAVSAIAAAIAAALEARGWRVRHQIGCAAYRIDVAVVDPDDPSRYVLGIETDGAAYALAPTARDRDRLRALVLGGLGWRLHRVWSLDWWADADKEAQRAHAAVVAAVAAARQARQPRVPRATRPPKSAPVPAPVSVSAPASAPVSARASVSAPASVSASASASASGSGPTAPVPAVAKYVAASVPAGRRMADQLYEDRYADEVSRIITVVLAAEAPVHFDLLARRVGAYFGIGRVTAKLTDRLRALLGDRGVFGAGDDHDVVWRPDQDRVALPGVRVSGEAAETKRDIDEVPLAEIAAAAAVVLSRTAGGPVDDLVKDAAKLLGFARVTDRIAKRVRAGVDALVQRGGCVVDAGRASLPARA